MKEFLLLEKQVGETPLQCLERFRVAHSDYLGVKMTYAGRLDPMAGGLMIVLAGDAVHQKDSYLKLPKVYECTVLLGVATDTYDVLGIPSSETISEVRITSDAVQKELGDFIGTFRQEYPPYSSKTIGGKQLHSLARSGGLAGQEIPAQMVTVSSISDIEIKDTVFSEVVAQIIANVSKVQGDFRQAHTIASWQTLAQTQTPPSRSRPSRATYTRFSSDRISSEDEIRPPWEGEDSVQTISFKISVSGGTYIRSIAHELGQKLGTGACVLSLHRTQIGDFSLENKDF